jgi:hypothetical protein
MIFGYGLYDICWSLSTSCTAGHKGSHEVTYRK